MTCGEDNRRATRRSAKRPRFWRATHCRRWHSACWPGMSPPPEVAAVCCAELAGAAGPSQLVGGQADDLDPGLRPSDVETLEAIHRRKTGAMFVASLRLGGLCSQATDEQLGALTSYGRDIGLAFQIADDLLDVQGDELTVGKRIGKDESNGKLTFPRSARLGGKSPARGRPGGGGPRRTCTVWIARGSPGSRRAIRARKGSVIMELLSRITSPDDLRTLSVSELEQLAGEMRGRAVQSGQLADGPFRLEPRGHRALPGAAHFVRL